MAETEPEDNRSATPGTLPEPQLKRGHKFPFLDGLRGYAALWVMIGHSRAECVGLGLKDVAVVRILNPIHESWAVPVFIALSGFLLTSQVCQPSKLADHNPLAFMMRRGRRIYPSYLAAILFCLLISAGYSLLGVQPGVRWQDAVPVDAGAILTHIALIHNWFPGYIHKIDPPMWSLGVEWQIYVAFAFITVPLVRRFGWVSSAILTTVLIAASAKLDSGFAVLFASFAMGGISAYFRSRKLAPDQSSPQPYGSILAAAIGIALAFVFQSRGLFAEIFISAASAFGVYALSHPQTEQGLFHWIGSFMENRVSRFFGWCSYSLYLVHFPIISAIGAAAIHLGLKGTTLSLSILLLGWALSLAVAALFAKQIEYALVNKSK